MTAPGEATRRGIKLITNCPDIQVSPHRPSLPAATPCAHVDVMLPAIVTSLLLLATSAYAAPSPAPRARPLISARPSIPRMETPSEELPVVSRNGTQLPSYTKTYYFNQLIDHNNPSLGTFRQRYWHTYEFYEPGEPTPHRMC